MNTIGVEIREDGTVKRSTDNVTTKREQKHEQISAQGKRKLRPEPRTALALSCLLPVLWLLIGSSAFAQSAVKESAGSLAAHVPGVTGVVGFAGGAQWNITAGAVDKFGLVISHAQFKKPGSPSFINVLYDGRIAEIFVPYHAGTPRFFDISGFNFLPLTLTAAHCPPPDTIIDGGKTCKSALRKYLLWTNGPLTRYGEEVVYFSILGAGNYNYIMEWTFRDDGTIRARAGSSGPRHASSLDGHMHNFTWRLDIDLNGHNDDFVYFTTHTEPGLAATDAAVQIKAEGNKVWDAFAFNTAEICDGTLKNGRGRRTCYELVPSRSGTARHVEPFTKADFWFTQYVGTSEETANLLPDYISSPQNLDPATNASADAVVWYTGSVHHETNMRDEDHTSTPVLWVGFELVPKNLFDDTPYYP